MMLKTAIEKPEHLKNPVHDKAGSSSSIVIKGQRVLSCCFCTDTISRAYSCYAARFSWRSGYLSDSHLSKVPSQALIWGGWYSVYQYQPKHSFEETRFEKDANKESFHCSPSHRHQCRDKIFSLCKRAIWYSLSESGNSNKSSQAQTLCCAGCYKCQVSSTFVLFCSYWLWFLMQECLWPRMA